MYVLVCSVHSFRTEYELFEYEPFEIEREESNKKEQEKFQREIIFFCGSSVMLVL
jgi:hypothetical protein